MDRSAGGSWAPRALLGGGFSCSDGGRLGLVRRGWRNNGRSRGAEARAHGIHDLSGVFDRNGAERTCMGHCGFAQRITGCAGGILGLC
jgi:hypothetical protein